jgi:hypothetical protein
MRHQVSSRQLVLWPRHEISEVWAPSGICHPPPEPVVDTGDSGDTVDETEHGTGPAPVVTALTRDTGTCGQVGRGTRRRARGGVSAGRRMSALDLV